VRQLELDTHLENLKLTDLRFKTGNKILGKGSYGMVELAEHK